MLCPSTFKKIKVNNFFLLAGLSFILAVFLSGCGTLWGGRCYYATFRVVGSKDVSIYYNGQHIGDDNAPSIKIPRNDADKINILLKKEGCEDYSYRFMNKVSRPGPSVQSAFELLDLVLALMSGSIVIPLSSIIDLSTGGYFKPDNIGDPRIEKINYDYFVYNLEFPNDLEPQPLSAIDTERNRVVSDSLMRLNNRQNNFNDSILKVNQRQAFLRDSLDRSSVLIRKAVLSDTLLIRRFFDAESDSFNLSKYMLEYPHVYYPDIKSYMEILIPESDEILFNPMVDTTYKAYYLRVYNNSGKPGYGQMDYIEFRNDNDIIEYSGIKMQKFVKGRPSGQISVGTWRYFYSSGKIKEIVNFNVSGEKNGLHIMFDEKGKITQIEKYVNGVLKVY